MKIRITSGELFVCQSCKDKPTFKDKDLMREHLSTVHNVGTMKGERKLILNMDGRGHSSSTFFWTVAGVEFVQFTVNAK